MLRNIPTKSKCGWPTKCFNGNQFWLQPNQSINVKLEKSQSENQWQGDSGTNRKETRLQTKENYEQQWTNQIIWMADKNQKDNQRQKLCRLERSRWSFLYNDWTKNNQASIIFCIFSWTALIRRLSQQQTISKFESTIYQFKQGPSLNIQGSVEQFLTMFELKCQATVTYYLLLHR